MYQGNMCWHCFKDQSSEIWLCPTQETPVSMCKGCNFELTTWLRFLKAYGFRVTTAAFGDEIPGGDEVGVVKGEEEEGLRPPRPSKNGRTAELDAKPVV